MGLGKKVIDSHLKILKAFSADIGRDEAAAKDPTTSKKYSDILLDLAGTEEALAKTLNLQEQAELKAYADAAFADSRDDVVRQLKVVGISEPPSGASAPTEIAPGEKPVDSLAPNAKAINGGYCYVTGFLVFYTRCCANNAGRGVYVGTAGYGCCNLVACDGCPRMIPSCPH